MRPLPELDEVAELSDLALEVARATGFEADLGACFAWPEKLYRLVALAAAGLCSLAFAAACARDPELEAPFVLGFLTAPVPGRASGRTLGRAEEWLPLPFRTSARAPVRPMPLVFEPAAFPALGPALALLTGLTPGRELTTFFAPLPLL